MLAAEAQAVLDAMAATGAAAIETLNPPDAKQQFIDFAPRLQGPKEAVAEIHNFSAGAIPLRLYRGTGCPAAAAPCLVYFHGGGWVVGNIDTHDNICRWIANLAQSVVISVDYRLAPEHPFPAAIEDAAAALRHVVTEAGRLGIGSDRISLGGDSAGGNIAAVLALMARDGDVPPVTYQILLYPVTDLSGSQESYHRFAEGYGLTTAAMRWFRAQYLGLEGKDDDWRASPLRASSVAGVAPAFIMTAGHDPLHDEAMDYAARLRDAHVSVVVDANPHQIHGFLSMDAVISAGRPSIARAVRAWQVATGLIV